MEGILKEVQAVILVVDGILAAANNQHMMTADQRRMLEELRRILGQIKQVECDYLPEIFIRNTKAHLRDVLARVLTSIRGFTPSKHNSIERTERDWTELFQQLDTAMNEVYGYAARLFSYDKKTLNNKQLLEESVRVAREASVEATKQLSSALQEVEVAKQEQAKVIEALKNAAGRGGALSLQEHYKEAKGEYDGSAKLSLQWAVVSGIWTITASYLLIQPNASKTMVELLDHLLPRIIPLSVLVTSLVYCLKSYQAQKHNSVINHHREILFRTLDAFAESQHEKDTKNAIIVMMVRSASEVQPTGYLSGQTESPQINQFNDLKKSIGG